MATLVEGHLEALFSIATTPRCREGATLFPGLIHFTLDPYLIVLCSSSIIFWVFGMTWPGIEPWSPGPLANTLLIWPRLQQISIYPYIFVFSELMNSFLYCFERSTLKFWWFLLVTIYFINCDCIRKLTEKVFLKIVD